VREFFVGSIAMWSGLLSNIPKGWALCDGTNGTPDLRERFVRGALNQGQMNNTGGATNHDHVMFGVNHRHLILGGNDIDGTGFDYIFNTSTDVISGDYDLEDGRPPFYNLAYIIDTGVI